MELNLPDLMVFPLHRASTNNTHEYLTGVTVGQWMPEAEKNDAENQGVQKRITEQAAFELSEQRVDKLLDSIEQDYIEKNGCDPSSKEKFSELARTNHLQRVIIGTNFIETGITVTATYVIEPGFQYETAYNAVLGSSPGKNIRIAKDKSRQRWGRVGRKTDGQVFCTYSCETFLAFSDFTQPEITKVNLDKILLTVLRAGVCDINSAKIFGIDLQNKAHAEEYRRAVALLRLTGAVDQFGNVTDIGMVMEGQQAESANLSRVTLWGERLSNTAELCTFVAFLQVLSNDRNEDLLMLPTPKGHKGYERIRRSCRDDLECYLKIFILWYKAKEAKNEETFIVEFGFNSAVLEKIEEARSSLIKAFEANAHISDIRRQLDIGRIDRVRAAILRTQRDWVFRCASNGTLHPLSPRRIGITAPLELDEDSVVSSLVGKEGKYYVVLTRKFKKEYGVQEGIIGSNLVEVNAELLPFLNDGQEPNLVRALSAQGPTGKMLLAATTKSMNAPPVPIADARQYNLEQEYYFEALTRKWLPDEDDVPLFEGQRVRNKVWYLLRDSSTNVLLLATMKRGDVLQGETFRAFVESVDASGEFLTLTQEPILEQLRKENIFWDAIKVVEIKRDRNTGKVRELHLQKLEPGIIPVIKSYQFEPWEELADIFVPGDSLKARVSQKQGAQLFAIPCFKLLQGAQDDPVEPLIYSYCHKVYRDYNESREGIIVTAVEMRVAPGVVELSGEKWPVSRAYVYDYKLPAERIDQFIEGEFYLLPKSLLSFRKERVFPQKLKKVKGTLAGLPVTSTESDNTVLPVMCGIGLTNVRVLHTLVSTESVDGFTIERGSFPLVTTFVEKEIRQPVSSPSLLGLQFDFQNSPFASFGRAELLILKNDTLPEIVEPDATKRSLLEVSCVFVDVTSPERFVEVENIE
jgi:hypothetical protein